MTEGRAVGLSYPIALTFLIIYASKIKRDDNNVSSWQLHDFNTRMNEQLHTPQTITVLTQAAETKYV